MRHAEDFSKLAEQKMKEKNERKYQQEKQIVEDTIEEAYKRLKFKFVVNVWYSSLHSRLKEEIKSAGYTMKETSTGLLELSIR